VLVLTRSAGLAGLITESSNLTEYESLRAFGLLDRTLTVDLVFHGTHEVLARAMHEDYVKAQIDEGETRDTNPSTALWESLPGHLKESNRAQAGHIGEKLRAVHCTLTPIMDSAAASFEFSGAEIEELAQMEHERWLAERRDNGWQYIDGPKDTEKKLSPDLVPWEDLNKDAKDKDRVFIRGLPLLLARAGFQIIRRERTAMSTEMPGQEAPTHLA
jgi:hypothetical protein